MEAAATLVIKAVVAMWVVQVGALAVLVAVAMAVGPLVTVLTIAHWVRNWLRARNG